MINLEQEISELDHEMEIERARWIVNCWMDGQERPPVKTQVGIGMEGLMLPSPSDTKWNSLGHRDCPDQARPYLLPKCG